MSYCFATMAVGAEYIELVKNLLLDILRYFPNSAIYVLTDSEKSFSELPITTVQFKRQGYWYMYHEKQQALRAATEKYDVCLFLDADCRLVFRPPMEKYCQLPTGIYGAYCQNFSYRFQIDSEKYTGSERWLKNTPGRRARLLKQYCNYLEIDFESCFFLHEACILYVGGNECKQLLKIWDYMARDLSAKLFEWGEGFVIGIAAKYLKISADVIPELESWLFKDLLTSKVMLNNPVYQKYLTDRKAVSSRYHKKITKKIYRIVLGSLRYLFLAPVWFVFYRQRYKQALKG